MQGIFQKENTDKDLKYGIYRHLPTYEKIIRNLVSFCFKHIKNFDKGKTLIIGDSLSSDMQGGINAKIDTCWYNPDYLKTDMNLNYIIHNLKDLEKILK